MMSLGRLFATAIRALRINLVRTGLAMLGIVIGIGAVIALVGLGQASQQQVTNQIQSLGSNLVTVQPGATRSATGVSSGFGGATTLTNDDAAAIGKLASVNTVSPEYSRRAQITAGKTNTNTTVIGAFAAYPSVHNLTMSSGSFLTTNEDRAGGYVAVIGPQVVSDLFGAGSDPVGATIRINKLAFRVIGVTASKGGSGFQNTDDQVYVPLLTAQRQLFGATSVSSIAVAAKDPSAITTTENEIGYLLLQRHKLSDPTQADFSMLTQQDILGAASQITGTLTSLLAGIAAISLIVGGIGIMNVMLMTVIERTREIGLRKALGARRRTVVSQFLIEALILTGVGGFIGMLLGLAAVYAIAKLINLPFAVAPSAIALAIGVSAAIGLVFGWYPAQRAAKLSPIEALRYE